MRVPNIVFAITASLLMIGVVYIQWSRHLFKTAATTEYEYNGERFQSEYGMISTGDASQILMVAARAYPSIFLPAPQKEAIFPVIDYCFHEFLLRQAAIRGSEDARSILSGNNSIVHRGYRGAQARAVFDDSDPTAWNDWRIGTPPPVDMDSFWRYGPVPFVGGVCPAVSPVFQPEYFRFKRAATSNLLRQNRSEGQPN